MSEEQGDRWGEITRHLVEWREGDADASKRLFVIIYDELHIMARRQRHRVPGQAPSLSTTALVHEAYLKLMAHSAPTLLDRQHFFALAAKAMRQILVDHARRRLAHKRGGDSPVIALDEKLIASGGSRATELVALDDALSSLQVLDTRLGQIIEMRFFAGLSVEETAEALGVSPRTIKRGWHVARAYLFERLQGPPR